MSLSNQKPIKENNNFNVLRKILRKTKESNLMGVRYYPEDETSYWYHPTFVCQKYVLDNEKKRVYSYLESFGVTFADLLKSGAKTGYEIDHIIGGTKEKTKETKKFIVETKYKIKKTTYNFSQNDINFSGYDSELYVIDWGRSEKIKRKLIKFNNKIKKNNDNIYELKQTKNGTKKTFTLKNIDMQLTDELADQIHVMSDNIQKGDVILSKDILVKDDFYYSGDIDIISDYKLEFYDIFRNDGRIDHKKNKLIYVYKSHNVMENFTKNDERKAKEINDAIEAIDYSGIIYSLDEDLNIICLDMGFLRFDPIKKRSNKSKMFDTHAAFYAYRELVMEQLKESGIMT
tara:strand:- start:531 stop:1565 length:1035 start_codon:yes stop_codon:yes gene_type:complete